MDAAAVVVKNLSIARGGVQTLRRISFEIQPGSVVGLIGPSGSGKTTLIRSIVGLKQVTDGDVLVMGLAAGSSPLRDRVGYMAQSSSVYEDLTVRQNIAYFVRILGYPYSEVDRVIRQVDLHKQRDQLVEKVSGGQRARVSLAIALIGRPTLLVLDEPTVGLDPVLRQSLWGLFRALGKDGVTLLISSHVMDEAAHCDQLLLLRGGRLIADDTVQNILEATDTQDVEAAFLQLVGEGKGDV
jgi:ABC-2 type transport system ATP-binding protein